MPKQKVYISSTFRDLKEYRATLKGLFETLLKGSFELTNIMELMYDDGSMTPFVTDCVNAVNDCDIYIIILGNKVGSFPPGETRTYTEIEFDTASAANKSRFLLKLATFDESQIDNKEKHDEILKKFEGRASHLFSNVTDFELGFFRIVSPFLAPIISPEKINKVFDYDKIYYCDRSNQNLIFDQNSKIRRGDAIQFHLITCNARDMPQFFVKRKKMEFDEADVKSIDLFVNPTITEGDNYELLEFAIKSAIKEQWNKNGLLCNYKIKPFDDLEIQDALNVLEALNHDYLIISWQISSIYWKNDNLQAHINTFYERYSALNATLNTKKKIFLIGIISYIETKELSYEQFQQKIISLKYGGQRIELSKIKPHQITEWLIEQKVEDNQDKQMKMIEEYGLCDENGFFMSELEDPLRKMLENSTPDQ
jgi:hypothetical protein